MSFSETPWGRWDILLEETYCKVKKITVHPQQRLSYQYHHKREERWTVVQGIATVTLDGKEIVLEKGDHIHIPTLAKHRVENRGTDNLIFIEIQQGEYFGEDDIVRIEDDYGRG